MSSHLLMSGTISLTTMTLCNVNRQQLLELGFVLGVISWLCISFYVIVAIDLTRVGERPNALRVKESRVKRTHHVRLIHRQHLLNLMKHTQVEEALKTRLRIMTELFFDDRRILDNSTLDAAGVRTNSKPIARFTKLKNGVDDSLQMELSKEVGNSSQNNIASLNRVVGRQMGGQSAQWNSTSGSNKTRTNVECNSKTKHGNKCKDIMRTERQSAKSFIVRKLRPIKNKNVRRFPYYFDDPGEDGDPVLSDSQEKADVAYKAFSFNDHVSRKISVERSIPDTRHETCRRKRYDYTTLPRASIIICFTNESWSALIRSVHSVINRTPTELIHEILLVDDFSQLPHLRHPLDAYIAANFRSIVKVIRLPLRHGLARARMAGLDAATGDVVTFLDSHIECNVGWLEPLLDAVATDHRTVASPVIDTVDDTSFRYVGTSAEMRGGFNWDMQFIWTEVPRAEAIRRNKLADGLAKPIRTPTIAGGLFAIDRKWFVELGGHDPGLEIWGAENLELSFKTWMCGGRLLIVPCSRVGHVFRSNAPYTFTGNDFKILSHNNGRVAAVWMDDYGKLFLRRYPDALNPINSTAQCRYDLEARRKLRRDLGCRSFASYLDTAYPELYRPSFEPVARGQLRHVASGLCMIYDRVWGLSASRCVSETGDLYFQLSPVGRVEHVDYCLGLFSNSSVFLTLTDCNAGNTLAVQHKGPNDVLSTADQQCVTVQKALKSHFFLIQLVRCNGTALDLLRWTFSEYQY